MTSNDDINDWGNPGDGIFNFLKMMIQSVEKLILVLSSKVEKSFKSVFFFYIFGVIMFYFNRLKIWFNQLK